MNEVAIGQYSVPVVLAIVLGIIYNAMGDSLSNRPKPLIAIGVGITFGLVAMVYNQAPSEIPVYINYALYGLMKGAEAVGIYEGQKAVRGK